MPPGEFVQHRQEREGGTCPSKKAEEAARQRRRVDRAEYFSKEIAYENIQAKMEDHDSHLQRLKDTKDYRHNKLVTLREAIKQEHKLFEDISEPIHEAIRQFGAWREEWLMEKKRWKEWQDSLVKEKGLDQLRSNFEKANDTIHTALNLVLPQLEAMFRIQDKGGTIDARLKILTDELDSMIVEERRGALLNEFPPMFSMQFLSQLRSRVVWDEAKKGMYEISWPGARFFARQGWIVLLQGIVSLFVIIPNADLVTNQVTNWTLSNSNRRVRLIIPVGVAYGSDVPLVIETLMACADAHAMVAKTPAPQVLFMRFGESTLDFELRVWISDIGNRSEIPRSENRDCLSPTGFASSQWG
jgi:hypothetical protein